MVKLCLSVKQSRQNQAY